MASIEKVENAISNDRSNNPKKRKRPAEASEELEVDINAPEPPSKKALRKAKKARGPNTANTTTTATPLAEPSQDHGEASPTPQTAKDTYPSTATPKRSAYGIWIGNLLYTTSKTDLRSFFTSDTNITESMITRIHMPAPSEATSSRQKVKSQNKGFAYVDFSIPEALAEAMALSETLLAGRKVLIKDARNFEGRPEKKDDDAQASTATKSKASGKPPSKRIFVGNLAFDTEKEDLEEHFSQCGEVIDVHVATFEDSGKCKGYAWVTFGEVDAAEAAVRGWVVKRAEDSTSDEEEKAEERESATRKEDEDGQPTKPKKHKKKPKDRKWYVNKLKGRPLRMEFAEDASVRYKKRFGKDANTNTRAGQVDGDLNEVPAVESKSVREAPKSDRPHHRPPKKTDARNVKPGAALAAAPRLTGGIIASRGKKTMFV